jgi:hypothetical protein
MRKSTREANRVSVTGVGWKKSMTISADRFDQVSKAILAALTTEPIKFTELAQRVAARLPSFEGSVPWYTVSVARELEVQGKIIRHARPVLYSKASKSVLKPSPSRPPKSKAASPARKARRVRSGMMGDTLVRDDR